MLHLANNIKTIRELSGLTQPQFGAIFDASKAMIVSYENGKAAPSELFIKRLAKMVGATSDTLKNGLIEEEHIEVEKLEKLKAAYLAKAAIASPQKNQDAKVDYIKNNPLSGNASLQDLLQEKDQRIKEAQAYAVEMKQHYNDMLARLAAEQENVSQAQGTIQKTLEKMESNLSQGQKNIEKQLLHSTENLGELMAKHKADLKEQPSLKRGSGLGRRKDRDGDGEHKGHQ